MIKRHLRTVTAPYLESDHHSSRYVSGRECTPGLVWTHRHDPFVPVIARKERFGLIVFWAKLFPAVIRVHSYFRTPFV